MAVKLSKKKWRQTMRHLAMLAFGLILWHKAAPAQTNNLVNPTPAESSGSGENSTGVTSANATPEFTPLT
jgi:hypothetical protein